jgi:hypothetical protein
MRLLLALSALFLAGTTMAISCGQAVPRPTETPIPAGTEGPWTPPPSLLPADFPPPDPLASYGPVQTPPVLTQEQSQSFEEIMRNDPRMVDISGGVPYRFEHAGPWYAGTATDTGEDIFIGATAYVVFSRPIDHVDIAWPSTSYRPYYAAWPASERAKYLPYREATERYSVDNLVEMNVSVDLVRGKLVSMSAYDDVRYGQVVTHAEPAYPTPQFSTEAPQEAIDIFNADARVQALLDDEPYQTLGAFTYSVGDTDLASIRVVFEEVHDVETDWSVLIDFDLNASDFEMATIHFTARDVRFISGVIDLDRHELVLLEPVRESSD